jgi:hypothetical protein
MKIKITNVFEPDKTVVIEDLQDDTTLNLKDTPNSANLVINGRTKDGFPFFINMSRGACLAVAFLKD